MRISVLGCGRWGSFLAWYLCRTGHEVTLYGRAASWRMERLLKCRENDLLQIPEGVQLTTDLAAAVSRAEALVISVGVQSLRSFLRELAGLDLSGRALVLCMRRRPGCASRRSSRRSWAPSPARSGSGPATCRTSCAACPTAW